MWNKQGEMPCVLYVGLCMSTDTVSKRIKDCSERLMSETMKQEQQIQIKDKLKKHLKTRHLIKEKQQ